MSARKDLMTASASLIGVLFLACFWSSAAAQKVNVPLLVKSPLTSIAPDSVVQVLTLAGTHTMVAAEVLQLVSAQLRIQAGDTSGKLKVLNSTVYIGTLAPVAGIGGWSMPLSGQVPLPVLLPDFGGPLLVFGQVFPASLIIHFLDLTPSGDLTIFGSALVQNTDSSAAHTVGISGSVLFDTLL